MSGNHQHISAEALRTRPAFKLAVLLAAIVSVHLAHNFSFHPFGAPAGVWQDFRIGIVLSQPMLVAFAAAFLPPPRLAWLSLGALVVLLLGVASQLRANSRTFDSIFFIAMESDFVLSVGAFFAVRRAGWDFRKSPLEISTESGSSFSMRTLLFVVTVIAIGLGLMRIVGGRFTPSMGPFVWICAVFTLLGLGPSPSAWLLLATRQRWLYALVALGLMSISIFFSLVLSAALQAPSRFGEMALHLSVAELGALASTLLTPAPLRFTHYRLVKRPKSGAA